MSIIANASRIDITSFSGANQLQDETSITPPDALSLQNCEFVEGSVLTRRGFAPAWSAARAITSMWNWLQAGFNRLIILDRTASAKVTSHDLASLIDTDILTSGIGAPVGMVNAAVGYRMMMAFFESTGLATTEGRIWDSTITSGLPNVEKLFPHAPVLNTDVNAFAFAEPAIGAVTAGLHNFAVIVTTWNGAQTPPGPINASSVLEAQAFVASGGKNLRITLTPTTTWPLWINQVQIAMTPETNPNRWFLVPDAGASSLVPRGSALTVALTFDMDDTTLQSEGEEITSTLFNLFVQSAASAGPFFPHTIVAFGNRIVYATRLPSPDALSVQGAFFVSEIAKPQYITRQFHLLSLPEFRDITALGVYGATLFVFGSDWTYAFSDNTLYPVQWAPCQTISTNIGSPFIKGITTNIARQVMWVCSKVGLFAFTGGTYTVQPASYVQGTSDWSEINWNAPADCLEVIDYPDKRLVVVKAPIGIGQSTANFLLVWDYSRGYDASSIRYCGKWRLNTSLGVQIQIGAIAMVHSQANNFEEFYLASRAASPGIIYRQKYQPIDAPTDPALAPIALYDDNGAGIDDAYQLALITAPQEEYYVQLGASFRMEGNGDIAIMARSTDDIDPQTLAPIPGGWQTGKTFLRLLDKQSTAVSYEVSSGGAAGNFFSLSAIRAYFRKWLEQGDS